MRILTAAVILATAATGTAAFAQTRLSDAAFIKAARCSGLAGADDTRFADLVKANQRGRAEFVADKAQTARMNAQREAKRAGEGTKAQIEAELSGVCASLAS